MSSTAKLNQIISNLIEIEENLINEDFFKQIEKKNRIESIHKKTIELTKQGNWDDFIRIVNTDKFTKEDLQKMLKELGIEDDCNNKKECLDLFSELTKTQDKSIASKQAILEEEESEESTEEEESAVSSTKPKLASEPTAPGASASEPAAPGASAEGSTPPEEPAVSGSDGE